MLRPKVALLVAEKPSVAKQIALLLSNGNIEIEKTSSKYNPLWEFDYKIQGEIYKLRVTSVLGHLMGLSFPKHTSDWRKYDYNDLYTEKIDKKLLKNATFLGRTLKTEAKKVDELHIWTDCD